ncbi:MAG: glycosyltransferase [Planctomycetes bacterium]|nr:glycosyltransferase [Planctomycetota bacterium]
MKYLIHVSQLFYPADTGGKIRSSNLFERLSEQHDVTIVCFRQPCESNGQLEKMRRCCSRLVVIDRPMTQRYTARFYWELTANLFSRYPYMMRRHSDRRVTERVEQLLGEDHFDVLLCDFLQPSQNLISVPIAPKILFQHNVESVILKRYYEQAANPVTKAYFYLQWRKLFRSEKRMAQTYDHCIMVSEQDCQTMADLYGVGNTSAIPTGVDVEYFRPGEPEAERNNLIFTGSMDWLPNEDAMIFFAGQILPLIRRKLDVKFWIVGRNPTPAVQRLAEENADVEVTGTVDDVRPFIDRASVYVVPLRVGGGTRIKIFEAMAMGKAVVSTRVGAEGLPVSDGENIILADEPEQFARKTIELLEHNDARSRLGEAACRLVRENYTWDVAAKCFSDICERVARSVKGN